MNSHPHFPEIAAPTARRQDGETYTKLAERRLAEIGRAPRGPISEGALEKRGEINNPVLFPEDVPEALYERSQAQIDIDNLIDGLDFMEAYRRWIGGNVKDRGKEVLISCPLPSHPDRNPSASATRDTGLWHCHKCQVGGDKIDLAAIHFGYDLNRYKDKDVFPELRLRIAEDLGYRVSRSGQSEWLEPVPVPGNTAAEAGGSPSEGAEEVTDLGESTQDSPPVSTSENLDGTIVEHPTLDWRTLDSIRPGTFLHDWLEATSHGDEPEEFYLGLGLQMLGIAVGNDVKLSDSPMVRANTMMAIVGSSGTGKSIACGRAMEVLYSAFPYSMTGGVKVVRGVGSGEALVQEMDVREDDPNNPQGPKIVHPVNALFYEGEMASLAARTKRPGATMRQYLMELFDSSAPVATSSRTHGRSEAIGHYFNVLTTTQPAVLKDIFSGNDAASGYLNRWLYIFGNIKRRRAIRPSDLVDLTGLDQTLRRVRSWASIAGGRTVSWSDRTAREDFEQFFHGFLDPLMQIEDAWLAQRFDLMAKKLCLIFAINDHSTTVLSEHVTDMKRVMQWLIKAYGIIEDRAGGGHAIGEAKEIILSKLKQEPSVAYTVRELRQQSRQLAKIGKATPWAITGALELLVKESEITVAEVGRKTTYSYNSQQAAAPTAVPPPSG